MRNARRAQVVALIRAIPRGFVQAYSDIDPFAPRMVGRMLADGLPNVPWHRVVRADGSIPMGARQRSLLRKEGVPMRRGRVDMSAARWPRIP